jgi:formylglycine-generating enzyme required for sulfatase activity
MKKRPVWLASWQTVVYVCVLAGVGASAGGEDGLLVAENGQARAVIVHHGHEKPAQALAEYLQKITGAEFPVRKERAAEHRGQSAIVLRVVDRWPGASGRETAQQAYRIHTAGSTLYLTGASELGLTYAVWGFLEDHLDCRFYDFRAKVLSYAGPGYEVIPPQPTLRLGPIDDTQEPAFSLRGFIYYIPITEWLIKNRGGGIPTPQYGGISASHNFYQLIPPDLYFQDHPEWFPLRNGKRETDWAMGLCGTNPGLAQEMARRLKEQMAQHQDPLVPLPAAQGDGFTGCQCRECRALVEKEGTEAAPLILLLNRALEVTTQKYPDHRLITFAYFDTLPAPKTLRPHPNLWLTVVSSSLSQNVAGDQVGTIRHNPANRDYARALADWPKIAPGRVVTWHWALTSNPLVEWPNLFFLPDDVRYWHECGVAGAQLQVNWGLSNWNWLRNWLFLKLAWNPQADAHRLIRQFLADYYGPRAAPLLWEYLQLTRKAYEEVRNGYVPSGVRWTNWPATLRMKMYPPPILAQMDALMEKAERAAQQEQDPVFATHVAQARGTSVDLLVLDEVKAKEPFQSVADPRDGQRWLVPGGRSDLPARIRRICDVYAVSDNSEHGPDREISWFVAGQGGPVTAIQNETYAVEVVPNLRGQIVSLVYVPTGQEILAADGAEFGYRDLFEGISSQLWSLAHADAARVETGLILSPPFYGYTPKNRLARSVAFTPDGQGVTITRRYEQDPGGGLPNNTRFTTRWMFQLPEPVRARVAVRGGGIEKLLDLRLVQAGGLRGEKVGVALPGADFMEHRFADVVAVSDAEVVSLPVTSAEGEVSVQLDRGDGFLVALTLPAAGWEKIDLQPVGEKQRLTVTLVGAPQPMDEPAKAYDLPAQTLRVTPMPPVPGERPQGEPATAPAVLPQIRITGPGRAVNERDGAELLWIPAGQFRRGSKKGEGAADERPQRRIYLDGYWMYRYPVTLQQYQAFGAATGREMPPLAWGQAMRADPQADPGAYPMLVNWYDAAAYAQWAGGSLPSEAQWEKAARGPDGRTYPWGNAWDPERAVGMERTVYRFRAGSLPVGSSPRGASPYGVEDLAGNVWEWVADWYQYDYYRHAPDRNPPGPATGTHKVLRGGDSLWDERFSRGAARMPMPPHVRDWVKTGFRCVLPGPPPGERREGTAQK